MSRHTPTLHVLRTFAMGLAILVVTAGQSPAWDLSGVLDVNAVRAYVEGQRRDTIRQDYNINLGNRFTPYLDFRAGFRYYRNDLAPILGEDSYTEQLQPNLELLWRHPLFSLSANGFRRELRTSPFPGSLTTDNVSVAFETIESRYPTVFARYDWQHVYDQVDVDFRDTSNERVQLGANWFLARNDLEYVFSHRVTDNVISGLSSSEDRHSFRWRGDYQPDAQRRWQIHTNYRFDYTSAVNEVATGSRLLQPIPVRLGLYQQNDAPELGTLAPVPGLSDGNTTVPTTPPIDIGGSTTGVNIGADLSVQRPVAALYVWTDRSSSGLLSWRVYTSEDNLNWTLLTSAPFSSFNPALNRYELEFVQVDVRYIKVVKDGLDAAPTVLVTEISAFEELPLTDEVGLVSRSNYLDLRAEYRISQTVRSSLDGTLVRDDAPGALGDRTQLDYALRGSWEPTPAWGHFLRWEQSLRWYDGDRTSEHDDGMFYTLLWDPWTTLGGNISINQRRGYVGGEAVTQLRSGLVRITGTPLPSFNLTLETGRNDNWDYVAGLDSRTYLTRTILDGRMLGFMDLSFAWSYSDILVQPTQDQRYRNTYTLGFSFRLTRTIYGRGNIALVNDVTNSTEQDYQLGWNLLPSLSLMGQYFLTATNMDYRSERYSLNLNWTLSASSTAYARYRVQDYRRAAGLLTESYELGLRYGF